MKAQGRLISICINGVEMRPCNGCGTLRDDAGPCAMCNLGPDRERAAAAKRAQLRAVQEANRGYLTR